MPNGRRGTGTRSRSRWPPVVELGLRVPAVEDGGCGGERADADHTTIGGLFKNK
jgi:hypothetical protein